MATTQDTEITLGTGKILGLFFGLVVLCAIFFSMGFTLGRNSVKAASDDASPAPAVSRGGSRPSSAINASNDARASTDMTFYKSVGQNSSNSELSSKTAPAPAPDEKEKPTSPETPAATAPLNGYYVQVAAVSKKEDADALVDALKKKQYAAVAAQIPADKLFHVEVGPFADIKDAEGLRSQLLTDGYNPILKK